MRCVCVITRLVPLISHVVPLTPLSIVWMTVLFDIESFNPLPRIHSKWDSLSSLHIVSEGHEIACTPILRTYHATPPEMSSCRSVCQAGSYIVILADRASDLTMRPLAGTSWASLCWHWRLRFLACNKCRDWQGDLQRLRSRCGCWYMRQ